MRQQRSQTSKQWAAPIFTQPQKSVPDTYSAYFLGGVKKLVIRQF